MLEKKERARLKKGPVRKGKNPFGLRSRGGKSNNLYERFKTYYWQRCNVTKYNTNINRVFSKYGLSNFSVTLLEYCKEQDLGLREQHYIDKIKPQYNIRKSVYNPKEKIVVKKTEEKPKLKKKRNLPYFFFFYLLRPVIRYFSNLGLT